MAKNAVDFPAVDRTANTVPFLVVLYALFYKFLCFLVFNGVGVLISFTLSLNYFLATGIIYV